MLIFQRQPAVRSSSEIEASCTTDERLKNGQKRKVKIAFRKDKTPNQIFDRKVLMTSICKTNIKSGYMQIFGKQRKMEHF